MIREDPPEIDSFKANVWQEEADSMRGNPGVWYAIADFPPPGESKYNKGRSLAHGINHGKHIAFRPAGSYEAKSRTKFEDGKKFVRVYVRYVG